MLRQLRRPQMLIEQELHVVVPLVYLYMQKELLAVNVHRRVNLKLQRTLLARQVRRVQLSVE